MTEPLIRVCRACGRYTLRSACPDGHGDTRNPHPARFSPTDRWAKYRRALAPQAADPTSRGAAEDTSP